MGARDVRDELIQLRGLRFAYRDWPSSKPNAPVLVLLHGYTGHARSWDLFAASMTSRYRVLALDQRGHGETQWAPATAYDTSEMVADLEAFVAAMGLDEFHAAGTRRWADSSRSAMPASGRAHSPSSSSSTSRRRSTGRGCSASRPASCAAMYSIPPTKRMRGRAPTIRFHRTTNCATASSIR